MPEFEPRLIETMRGALETVMTRVPTEYSTATMKAFIAEVILRAAARGETTYAGLVAVGSDQIQEAVKSLFVRT
ncbi:hypothetical protein [Bradyrhizobium sp. STM 3809]|uniref:hypothetical protein n=1 Tax=Bradyrhizobium sp. STM 3809 TaxID=551936 RepID=UPI000A018CC3|nr:hypothetical protein [Bradyrhizobium sp. STM 3809]